MTTPINPNPQPILNDAQPCKPRAYSTHTDRLPMTYRQGALDANNLPRVHGGWREWPDGRKERI